MQSLRKQLTDGLSSRVKIFSDGQIARLPPSTSGRVGGRFYSVSQASPAGVSFSVPIGNCPKDPPSMAAFASRFTPYSQPHVPRINSQITFLKLNLCLRVCFLAASNKGSILLVLITPYEVGQVKTMLKPE